MLHEWVLSRVCKIFLMQSSVLVCSARGTGSFIALRSCDFNIVFTKILYKQQQRQQ